MKPEAPGLHGQWLARIWERLRLSQIWQPSLDKDIAAKALSFSSRKSRRFLAILAILAIPPAPSQNPRPAG